MRRSCDRSAWPVRAGVIVILLATALPTGCASVHEGWNQFCDDTSNWLSRRDTEEFLATLAFFAIIVGQWFGHCGAAYGPGPAIGPYGYR
jgi:hypothetical protein